MLILNFLDWRTNEKSEVAIDVNCFSYIFRHFKLELLAQFPASNDEKYFYFF